MKKIKNVLLVLFPLILGGIVSLVVGKNFGFNNITKPPLVPPAWLFPIVWTIIYLLMGLSYYLYKKNSNQDKEEIKKIYYAQLFVNATWSIIFFTLKWYLLSSFWIILLDALVLWLLKKYKTYYKPSYYMNLLYLVWILFATYLTIGICILN